MKSKIFPISILLICLSPFLIKNNACSQTVSVTKIDSFFNDAAKRGIFEGTALLSIHDTVIYSKAFGYASREFKIKNNTSTKFRLASLSKTITVIAIMQLVQEGKLKVSDRISDILDWYPRIPGSFVSVENLMMMNSGIPTYSSYYDFPNIISRGNFTSVKEYVLAYCTGTPLLFTPGTDNFNYSNSNYYILGAIIEKLTGKPYAEVIEEKIFKPLGMKNSGYYYNTALYENMANGYTVEPVPGVADYYDQTSAYATGGLYSTTEDLFKLDQALYTEKILQKKYIDEIYKNRFPQDNSGNAWIYGWQFVPNTQNTMVFKTGILWGFRTLFVRDLKNHNAIILLNNTDNNNSDGNNMIVDLLVMMSGGNPPLPLQQDICTIMGETIKTKGVDAAIAKYYEIKSSKDSINWVINDEELFTVGQYLINQNQPNEAGKIFDVLRKDYPTSIWATYKSTPLPPPVPPCPVDKGTKNKKSPEKKQ